MLNIEYKNRNSYYHALERAQTENNEHIFLRWFFKNYKEFDEIIRKIRQEFPEMIKDFETLPTIQEYKFDEMVELI